MARPERHDADYFPFIVKDGLTLFALQQKFGLAGIGFFTNLMRLLCNQPDHHICIFEELSRLRFFARIGCDEETGLEMLGLMIKTEKIDRALWESHKAIVCPDLLESLKDAYKNRNNDIITIDEIRVSYHGNEVSLSGNEVKPADNTQSKVKETKVKETKEYNTDFFFDKFWSVYPRHIEKQKALKVWNTRIKEGVSPDLLITCAENYAKYCKAQGTEESYIKHPGTFLGPDKYYEDWQEEKKVPPPKAKYDQIKTKAIKKQREETLKKTEAEEKRIEQERIENEQIEKEIEVLDLPKLLDLCTKTNDQWRKETKKIRVKEDTLWKVIRRRIYKEQKGV